MTTRSMASAPTVPQRPSYRSAVQTKGENPHTHAPLRSADASFKWVVTATAFRL